MNAEHTTLYNRIKAFAIDEPDALLPFTARLAAENGWTPDDAQRIVEEYKKFVFLAAVAGHAVTPSDAVDQAWHLHLAYTRSYWETFCPQVLGRPLHHQPTRGGPAECAKFLRDYANTVESYQRFFGERPPADIWPEAEQRFSSEAHFQRVNTARSWVVPRWRFTDLLAGAGFLAKDVAWIGGFHRWRFTVLLAGAGFVLGSALLLVAGQMTSTLGTGNQPAALPPPLDLPGPAFLAFFAVAFGVLALLAAGIRWGFRRPADGPAEALELSAYETAYLAGGEEAVLCAALAALVSGGTLAVNASKRLLERGDTAAETIELHPVERSVLEALNPVALTSIEELRNKFVLPPSLPLRLKALGLIVADEHVAPGLILPLAVFLPVPVLGCIKILVGLSQEQPVGFLVLLCLFAVGVAAEVFGNRLHRTLSGDRTLARLREEHPQLKSGIDAGGQPISGTNLARALALFGIAVLISGSWVGLHTLLTPLAGTHGYGGGWGDSDGGGDGGGGCGGCGGCG